MIPVALCDEMLGDTQAMPIISMEQILYNKHKLSKIFEHQEEILIISPLLWLLIRLTI